MQSNGSLSEHSLRSLLESAQSERAIGILNVRSADGGAGTLYFLFGHLFHASADGTQGDDAVIQMLAWHDGDFNFDAKAKLPADETVRASIEELIESAGEKPASNGASATPGPAVVEAEAEPESEPTPVAQSEPEPEPEPEPARAAAPEPAPEPKPEPKPVERTEPPVPRRGVKHRPQPVHGREPVPVPAGQVIYDSLKTSFVDFPRLITTLEREAYTGYVRLLTDEAAGLILFRDGRALECAYDVGLEPGFSLGRQALVDFNHAVTQGHGVLDVVGLSTELVDGLYQLMTAQPLYTDLYSAWVDAGALLAFLEDRKLDGSITVRSDERIGVVILTGGQLTGAYTSESREISDSAAVVLQLCGEPTATIEVKSADPTARPPLDVDAVVGSHRTATGSTQPTLPALQPAPAPEPPPPAPEPAAAVGTERNLPAWDTGATATASAGQPTAPAVPAFTPAEPEPQAAWQTAEPAMPVEAPAPANAATTQSMAAVPSAEPEAEPTPAAAEAAPPAPEANPNVDWDAVVLDLQNMTEEALTNRSRKVKDVLGSAERTPAGLEDAINQVPSISILFVDSARLEALANALRQRLREHLSA